MIKVKYIESNDVAFSSVHWYRLYQAAAGAAVIIIGGMLLVGYQLNIEWLPYVTMPLIGLVFLIIGWIAHSYCKLVTGSILLGSGLAFTALLTNFGLTIAERVGLFGGLFGVGWVLIGIFSKLTTDRIAWWALIIASLSIGVGSLFSGLPIGVIAGLGVVLVFLALVFIAWGLVDQKSGMVITGGNLIGLGLGCMFAWSDSFVENILSKSGVMLVGLALGWVLIVFLSNFSGKAVLWWALIPAGVMGIVGWGLYISGRPVVSFEVIGNIGSIALIAIGLYLLLLRSAMHK